MKINTRNYSQSIQPCLKACQVIRNQLSEMISAFVSLHYAGSYGAVSLMCRTQQMTRRNESVSVWERPRHTRVDGLVSDDFMYTNDLGSFNAAAQTDGASDSCLLNRIYETCRNTRTKLNIVLLLHQLGSFGCIKHWKQLWIQVSAITCIDFFPVMSCDGWAGCKKPAHIM